MKLLIAVAAAALLALVACASSASTQTSTVLQPRGTIVFGQVINANGDEYAFTIHADGTGEKALIATSTCCMVWSHRGDRLTLGASACSACSIPTAIVNADGSG